MLAAPGDLVEAGQVLARSEADGATDRRHGAGPRLPRAGSRRPRRPRRGRRRARVPHPAQRQAAGRERPGDPRRRRHHRWPDQPAGVPRHPGQGRRPALPGQGGPEGLQEPGRHDQRQAHRDHRPADAPQGPHRPAGRRRPAADRARRPARVRGGQQPGPGRGRRAGDGPDRPAGRDQGVAQHLLLPCRGVLPGDDPGAHRGRHQRRQGPPDRAQGERHHRQADPGRLRGARQRRRPQGARAAGGARGPRRRGPRGSRRGRVQPVPRGRGGPWCATTRRPAWRSRRRSPGRATPTTTPTTPIRSAAGPTATAPTDDEANPFLRGAAEAPPRTTAEDGATGASSGDPCAAARRAFDTLVPGRRYTPPSWPRKGSAFGACARSASSTPHHPVPAGRPCGATIGDAGPARGRFRPPPTDKNRKEQRLRADDQPARASWPPAQDPEDQGARHAQELEQPAAPPGVDPGRPPEAGRVPAGPDDDAQEAELGSAQDRPRAPVQPDGGHGLHPGHRPQPPGALGRARARRTREGPAVGQVPHHPRHARCRRCA